MVRNEFSRPFRVERLRGEPVRLSIAAEPDERAALAARFELLALDALSADLELRRGAGGVVRIRGRLAVTAIQACVVTLEPVPAVLDIAFDLSFAEDVDPTELGDIDIDVEAADPPEPIENGEIDLGEAVVQQMAVTLDPYPRAAGVDSPGDGDDGPISPFAALRQRR